MVALVAGLKDGRHRYLLCPVGDVNVELLVVDADSVVGVFGGYGDLDGGGEDVWWAGGGGEVVDSDVLEDKVGLRRV